MKTTAQGKTAEKAVAAKLREDGFKILDFNWRRRTCEIDIIARKKKIIYFIEVKYRRVDDQGDGFAYLTSRKLTQIRYAAEIWINEYDYHGDYRLLAAAVSGPNCEEIEVIEL